MDKLGEWHSCQPGVEWYKFFNKDGEEVYRCELNLLGKQAHQSRMPITDAHWAVLLDEDGIMEADLSDMR